MDKESVLNIVKMVKDGTITPEEATELINALNGSEKNEKGKATNGMFGKKLVIRVIPKNEKGNKANITIPWIFAGKFLEKFVADKNMNVNVNDLISGMNVQVDDENEMIDIHIEE